MQLNSQREPQPLERIKFDGCPLCASKNTALHAKADCTWHQMYVPEVGPEITWLRCGDCSHVFTDGYFSEQQLAAVFTKAHANQLPGHDLERGRAISARMVERVAQYVKSGNWLDVGFGDGSLLMTAQEFGFNPIGIDLRNAAVEKLEQFGIEAHCSDLLQYKPDRQFAVISMADVLEHTPDPAEMLKAARWQMQSNGILFVSCPNMDTAAWRNLSNSGQNPYWGEVEHYHNFSRRRLVQLLNDCGFELAEYAVSERYRLGMELIARKSN